MEVKVKAASNQVKRVKQWEYKTQVKTNITKKKKKYNNKTKAKLSQTEKKHNKWYIIKNIRMEAKS